MALADAAQRNGQVIGADVAQQRYKAARAHALASGFNYKPLGQLVSENQIEDVVRRLLALSPDRQANNPVRPFEAEALLGGVPEPKLKVSQAFDVYVEEIAVDEQYSKSDQQKYQWRKIKRLSMNYFIDVIGDISMVDITRDHALTYQRWWRDRILSPKKGENPVQPNTANRHIGNVRVLYREYFKHLGEEERQNPFRNMFFKSKSRVEVPAFQNEWVQKCILKPGALTGLKWELQLITYMLIETGCRPSEIINLLPEHIHLDAVVPYISIKPREKREIKTESSIRDIPLVGVSLEAAKRASIGFAHYHDRNELFSANMMKAFRVRELFPSKDHRIYSFRHSFEKRMQEANIDYGLRCLLMGHKTNRPAYGDGGSLRYRQDELLKIAHPFDMAIFEVFDAEHAERALGN